MYLYMSISNGVRHCRHSVWIERTWCPEQVTMTRQATIATILSLSFLAVFPDVARSQTISFDREASQPPIPIHMVPKQPITCPDEEMVNLTGLALTDIYEKRFVKSSAIRSLTLEDNQLTYIPDTAFAKIPSLRCLNLARNQISFYGFDLKHNGLETLIIDHQRLEQTMDTLQWNGVDSCMTHFELPNLKSLSWKGFPRSCTSLPWSWFPQLKTIDLSDSDLTGIWTTNVTFNASRLETVQLKGTGIRSFSMMDFGSALSVYLDDNPLQYITFDPANRNLRLLSLAGCRFRSVDNFYSRTLMALDLSFNSLTSLPAHAFNNTPQLETLDLSWNWLEEFPNLAHLTGLKMLSLAYNRIDRLTKVYTSSSLIILILRASHIEAIEPSAFQHLSELYNLDLSDNQLESLPPNWHDGMQSLGRLDLRGNRFTTINDMMLATLSSLTELYAMENRLTTVDATAVQSLPSSCTAYVL